MGICFSCLFPGTQEDDYSNEEADPLLGGERYSDQNDGVNQEMRNKELENIVNSTSENLIDVSNLTQMEDPSFLHNTARVLSGPLNISIDPQGSQKSVLSQPRENEYRDTTEPEMVTVLDGHALSESSKGELRKLHKKISTLFDESCALDTSSCLPLLVQFGES